MVSQQGSLREVMGHDERGQADLADQRSQFAPHGFAGHCIQCRRGLVQQQHRRFASQCPGHRDPLTFTTRDLTGSDMPEMGDANARHH